MPSHCADNAHISFIIIRADWVCASVCCRGALCVYVCLSTTCVNAVHIRRVAVARGRTRVSNLGLHKGVCARLADSSRPRHTNSSRYFLDQCARRALVYAISAIAIERSGGGVSRPIQRHTRHIVVTVAVVHCALLRRENVVQ